MHDIHSYSLGTFQLSAHGAKLPCAILTINPSNYVYEIHLLTIFTKIFNEQFDEHLTINTQLWFTQITQIIFEPCLSLCWKRSKWMEGCCFCVGKHHWFLLEVGSYDVKLQKGCGSLFKEDPWNINQDMQSINSQVLIVH